MPASGCQAPLASTMSVITARMMTVRIKVAKSELMSWTPILPKMAVRAAKTADIAAQNCQLANRDFISNSDRQACGTQSSGKRPHRFAIERIVQLEQIALAGNLDGAKARQMRGDELGVEQDKAAALE